MVMVDWRYAVDGRSGTMLFCVSYCAACEIGLPPPRILLSRCLRLISLAMLVLLSILLIKL